MLRNLKQFFGHKLQASDGEIGRVKDFYFDDKHWAVRYVIADTGSWLTGRLVLLSPHAFGALAGKGEILLVNLTRKKIEKSPSIESHKPISRQLEEDYYQYYGWPSYWQGDAMWGDGGFPVLTGSSKILPNQPAGKGADQDSVSNHLRSVQAVVGYQIQAVDVIAGHVVDFVMDVKSWAITGLVINTGGRFTGKKVFVTTRDIARISWDESKIFVNLKGEAILELPEYDLSLVVST